jgi:succinate dehydrogenase/fumarate reductase cytochrome b subunit
MPGTIIVDIGVVNVLFIHPVPGIILLLLSLLYFSPSERVLQKLLGWTLPITITIILFMVILWFTLGINDLGDMID